MTSSSRPGVDVDARAPQDAAEDQQVVEEVRHRLTDPFTRAVHVAPIARSSSSAARLSAERLEIVLRLQHDAERVLDRVRIERVAVERDERRSPSRWSPTRRAPCSRSAARSSCTIAVTCSASRADASGTRSRTIASSFSKDGYSIH